MREIEKKMAQSEAAPSLRLTGQMADACNLIYATLERLLDFAEMK